MAEEKKIERDDDASATERFSSPMRVFIDDALVNDDERPPGDGRPPARAIVADYAARLKRK